MQCSSLTHFQLRNRRCECRRVLSAAAFNIVVVTVWWLGSRDGDVMMVVVVVLVVRSRQCRISTAVDGGIIMVVAVVHQDTVCRCRARRRRFMVNHISFTFFLLVSC